MRKKDPSKEEAIYKAFLSISRHKGLNAITMAEIAKEAGIASGTLYIYFKSKADLIHDMKEDLFRKRTNRLQAETAIHKDLRRSFENYWFSYLEYLLDHTDELFFLKQYKVLYQDSWEGKAQGTHFDPLEEVIRRGMESGIIEDGPVSVKAAFIINSLEEIVFAHSNGVLMLDQSGIAEAFRMATNSLFKA